MDEAEIPTSVPSLVMTSAMHICTTNTAFEHLVGKRCIGTDFRKYLHDSDLFQMRLKSHLRNVLANQDDKISNVSESSELSLVPIRMMFAKRTYMVGIEVIVCPSLGDPDGVLCTVRIVKRKNISAAGLNGFVRTSRNRAMDSRILGAPANIGPTVGTLGAPASSRMHPEWPAASNNNGQQRPVAPVAYANLMIPSSSQMQSEQHWKQRPLAFANLILPASSRMQSEEQAQQQPVVYRNLMIPSGIVPARMIGTEGAEADVIGVSTEAGLMPQPSSQGCRQVTL